ncbi:hypothetical protein [Altericroceibacterium xinjiangense]|uniref:hypothetical protein n=1 Tax=Altericroceibacterium xinjiangense TaxID=762261 RepID=UPI000F7D5E11|nr:hypothetical protein [Altericroceibacterium xinjiangense]
MKYIFLPEASVLKSIALIPFALLQAACGTQRDAIRDQHERLCKENAALIVYDPVRWTEYLNIMERELASLQRSSDELGIYLHGSGGYNIRFGEDLNFRRGGREQVYRADVFILYRGNKIARMFNYIAVYSVVGALKSVGCTTRFPELYLGERG